MQAGTLWAAGTLADPRIGVPQTVVMPRIADHPDMTKKRTNKGIRYEGVGIKQPESLLLLQKIRQTRREDEIPESALDAYF